MGTSKFFLLLPPSEGKAEGGTSRSHWDPESGVFGAMLHSEREAIVRQLKKLKGGDATLLGVKGHHLARAQAANLSLLGAPTLPAWQRYTGVVWDHLDLETFSTAAKTANTKRILIPSGVLGLVRADDPIPDYRLKMGARLAPMGTLNKWWRDNVTAALHQHVKKNVVIDLLPQEHRVAINIDLLPNVVRVDLVSKKGGVVGGHNAKAAKGLLARHLLMTKETDIRSMVSSFKHPEYSAKVST